SEPGLGINLAPPAPTRAPPASSPRASCLSAQVMFPQFFTRSMRPFRKRRNRTLPTHAATAAANASGRAAMIAARTATATAASRAPFRMPCRIHFRQNPSGSSSPEKSFSTASTARVPGLGDGVVLVEGAGAGGGDGAVLAGGAGAGGGGLAGGFG